MSTILNIVQDALQPLVEWVSGVLQDKKSSASEKDAQLQSKLRDLLAQQRTLVDSDPQTVLARELAVVRQAQAELAPQLKDEAEKAYRAKVAAWTERFNHKLAEKRPHLEAIERIDDELAAINADYPQLPDGSTKRRVDYSSEIFKMRDANVTLGDATRLFSRGGNGHEPRLAQRREIRIKELQ